MSQDMNRREFVTVGAPAGAALAAAAAEGQAARRRRRKPSRNRASSDWTC